MKISLIVPVFNEEEAIPLFYEAIKQDAEIGQYNMEIIFINDGSQDGTESICTHLAQEDLNVKLISLSRNFGKEAALFAGLQYATGDAVIPIDVDLQDPINVIPKLIQEWINGFDVVLAKRADRSSDSYLKRSTAEMFYKLHNKISQPKIEKNVGDFRLLDKKVVVEILKLPEKNLFMKGLLSWVGFKTTIVEYSRAPRSTGEAKFNGWKLWNFALEGITSFSTLPLRLWSYLGAFIAFSSFLYGFYMIFDKLFFGNNVPGYPSLLTSILFLGGIQLIGIGVLGEYIGKIYIESKNRPKFIVSNTINITDNDKQSLIHEHTK